MKKFEKALLSIAQSVCDTANLCHGEKSKPYECEWLEYGEDLFGMPNGDCQMVINFVFSGKRKRKTYNEVIMFDGRLFKMAKAVCNAMNSAMVLDNSDQGAWYVQCGSNWYDREGDDCSIYEGSWDKVQTIQYMIMKGY